MLSALWGKFAAEILTQNWEVAFEDMNRLKSFIDSMFDVHSFRCCRSSCSTSITHDCAGSGLARLPFFLFYLIVSSQVNSLKSMLSLDQTDTGLLFSS